MRRGPSRALVAWLLGAICIALAWLIYQELAASGPSENLDSAAAAPPPAAESLPSAAALPATDKAALAVIVERPVFSQTRRPSRAAGDSVPGSAIDFMLSGVVISGGERSALIQPAAGGAVQRLQEGQDFGGWTVTEIAADRITVRRDTIEAEMYLDYAAPAPATSRAASRQEPPAEGEDSQNPADQVPAEQANPTPEPGSDSQN